MIDIEMLGPHGPETIRFERFDGDHVRITTGVGTIEQTWLDLTIETWRKIVADVDPPPQEWTCGHVAGAMCAECYRQLAAKAHELAEQVLDK
jgi:hypothetical protein